MEKIFAPAGKIFVTLDAIQGKETNTYSFGVLIASFSKKNLSPMLWWMTKPEVAVELTLKEEIANKFTSSFRLPSLK